MALLVFLRDRWRVSHRYRPSRVHTIRSVLSPTPDTLPLEFCETELACPGSNRKVFNNLILLFTKGLRLKDFILL